MAFYYKINKPQLPLSGIQVYETNTEHLTRNPETFDFSQHVLIELLDDVTPEPILWEELCLVRDKTILHKRMMADSHRVHCRRAIVKCKNSACAKNLAKRISQTKIMKRCVCATVIQDLLFDFKLFEKQIIQLGDKRSQHQLLYVTDLNKCREASVLSQYLRDLFSPFGKILSVFVSEDKDGFAHPEGVIKFAHLSEAFAAELAYDQHVVGMERLSVTTHHNILLAQCDLRVRLREAQRTCSENLNNTCHSNYDIHNGISRQSKSSEFLQISDESQRKFLNPTELSEKGTYSLMEGDCSQSSELLDVLKNPCKTNLIDCLKSMTFCSDSSTTKDTVNDDVSVMSETDNNMTPSAKSSINLNELQESSVTLPLNQQNLSSRINDWISNISETDSLPSCSRNISICSKDDTIPRCNGFENIETIDNMSSNCSFITCDAQSPVASPVSEKSLDSDISSLNDSYMTVLQPNSSFHSCEGNLLNITKGVTDMSLVTECSSSIKRLNNSCSVKLSLKKQKLTSSTLTSNHEQTLPLSQSSKYLGLPENVLSDKNKMPVVCLKKLSPEEIQYWSSRATQDTTMPLKQQHITNPHSSLSSENKENNPCFDVPIQSSTQQSDCQSNCSSKVSNKERSHLRLSARPTHIYNTDSPLRAWLKSDLMKSSNVNLFENIENSRNIVCATSSKNVLAHVGCSHMTCDICYPGSTNLLFGCQ